MILVTAANGRTGRSVIGALVRSGHHVRAFDIAGDVEQLAGEGAAEAMVGDLLDPDDLRRAVEGVSTVVHIGPPMHPREAEMGHGVVSAARSAGVRHFVQFSVTHPQLEPLLNHQAKLAVERVVLLSRIPFTILQPMHYMQNIDVGHVVAEGVLRQAYSLDTRLAHVDLEDVAEVAAKVVGDPRHHYATYELCGQDFCNAHELARIIAAESGHEVTASQVELPVPAEAGISPSEDDDHRHDALFRLFDHYGRYGITGNPNVLGWLLARAPTGFGEYVRRSLASH
ncbi:MAG TPA: NmrA family NAD(P)-binding protein [Acidimicrobiales bacterium]|nr:NmrA family NAD(P)-binding protein [Acidimicrobiales bacterium]